MQKIIVTTNTLQKEWREMPLIIYANDANYIRPLDKDIEDVFNPNNNNLFKTGECERWLFADENGKYVARIAVFVNKKYKQAQPTGGFGFFECIADNTVATIMLDAAKDWLQQRGMQAMDGPINFGERDRWWGCLINGFDEPLYCMNYAMPYYQKLLENYGCQIYFNQLCFGMSSADELPARVEKIAAHYNADPEFSVQCINKKNIGKAAEDFCTIYNAAFAGHGEGKSMDIRVAKKMFVTMKPVLDENIAFFVYHNNMPVAMWLNLPDLNQYFKHFNGSFGLLQKLKFLYMQHFKNINRFLGVVYGVAPAWQGKGVDALMMVKCREYIKTTNKYKKFEMQWIGDFNPKMINLAKNLHAKEVRRLATYRYLFDRNIPFVRMGNV
jgi:hypothetical protein